MPNPETFNHSTPEENRPHNQQSPTPENPEAPKDYFAVITDADFGLTPEPFENPKNRQGARGIILNDEGKIGCLHLSKVNAYKLIGGGLEEGEDPETAFKREVMEEAGCKVEIDQFLGMIREEKSRVPYVQDSYVYVAHVVEDTGKLSLTERERSRGAKLTWLTLDEALEKVNGDNLTKYDQMSADDAYQIRFILLRDYDILERYRATISDNNPEQLE